MAEFRYSPLIVSGLNVLANGILSYYCFTRGEMDIAVVFAVLFLASIAASAYSVYEFSQKKTLQASVWYRVWHWVIFGFLASMLLLAGFLSGNVVTVVFGTFLLFAIASSFLTSYVRTDHVVKRALEVVFLFMALGTVIYGYVMTRSPILGIMLLFVAAMFFVAFVLSYLLPRIRGRSEGLARVKNEEKPDTIKPIEKLAIFQTCLDHEESIRTSYQTVLVEIQVGLFGFVFILIQLGLTDFLWLVVIAGIALCLIFVIACDFRAKNVDFWRGRIIELVRGTELENDFREGKYGWVPLGKFGRFGEKHFGHWFERLLVPAMIFLWIITIILFHFLV